ncbi:MAG: hypothetical protein AABZ02_14820, partial [Bacteroidota bacterium]
PAQGVSLNCGRAGPPLPLFGIPPYQYELLRREKRGARQNLPVRSGGRGVSWGRLARLIPSGGLARLIRAGGLARLTSGVGRPARQ